jgi:TatD DNase family protein
MEEHQSGAESYLEELSKLVADDRGEGGSKRIISIGEIGLGQSIRLDQARNAQG